MRNNDTELHRLDLTAIKYTEGRERRGDSFRALPETTFCAMTQTGGQWEKIKQ